MSAPSEVDIAQGNAALVGHYLVDLQERIVRALADLDGHSFRTDAWQKPEDAHLRGSGITAILEDGAIFERAGVGYSRVMGDALPASATAARAELAGRSFEALGVSLVLHPRNPRVPIVHMNVRYFVARKPGEAEVWWFGGGMDLTPCYGFDEDARHFHLTCKGALDRFDASYYPSFKAHCDRYFFLRHRNEMRGVGGIFFDDFNQPGFANSFALQQAVGDAFLPAYLPIVERRQALAYGERERRWQALRRGRYVEFNLVYDRGTLFGLQSGGRTESILMSMPPEVAWRYAVEPEPGSPEAELARFLVPQVWA